MALLYNLEVMGRFITILGVGTISIRIEIAPRIQLHPKNHFRRFNWLYESTSYLSVQNKFNGFEFLKYEWSWPTNNLLDLSKVIFISNNVILMSINIYLTTSFVTDGGQPLRSFYIGLGHDEEVRILQLIVFLYFF